MKATFFIFDLRALTPALLGACLLIAASTGCQTSRGVHTSATADVSQYPREDRLLPGKGPAQTWSDFPKIWATRHEEWAPACDRDHGAVVFLGDSITQGYTTLARDFPDLKVANRGIGGDTTRGVLYRLEADVLALEPAAVVLLIGTNDLGLGADPADVADNIRAIVARIRKANRKTLIIVCTVMPSSEGQHRPASRIKALNALLVGIAHADAHSRLCDTWSLYADADGNSKPEEFPDRLHPNAAGYAKWTAALRPLLAEVKSKAAR